MLVNASRSCNGIGQDVTEYLDFEIAFLVRVASFARVEAEVPQSLESLISSMMGILGVWIEKAECRNYQPAMGAGSCVGDVKIDETEAKKQRGAIKGIFDASS